ncbi:MAG: hypothetical protein ACOYT7_01220 [Patescibacteria group bacterium]
MAETKESGQGFSPNPEWKHDFSPGPSEEELARFKGPEWRSEIPDIKMQIPRGDNGEEPTLDLMRLLAAGRAVSTAAGGFGRALENLERAAVARERAKTKGERDKAEKERDEAIERLRHTYGLMMNQSLGVISKMYDETVDQKKNAYPYDHREAKFTIGTIEDAVETLGGEEWLKSDEGRVWLERLKRDTEWLNAFLQVSVTESASIPYYWDVVMQLQTLKERFRAYATEETFEKMFAGELPGLEVPTEHNISLPIPEKYTQTDESLVKPDEVLGLRELATRMQDASFETRMKLAAVSQADLTLKPEEYPETTTFLGTRLTAEELKFYKDLLWSHKSGDEEARVLTPYLSSKAKDYREVTATLEAILLTNAHQRLKNIIAGQAGDKMGAVDNLVKDVKDARIIRIANWFNRDKGDIVSRLATLITRQGYLQDFSLMHAYRYCWGYTFKTTEEGKVVGIKQVDIGGIHTGSGDIPSLYWARRGHKYDLESNSRTQLLFPTDRSERVELLTEPLGEMHHYKPEQHPDVFLREQWERLFGNDDSSKKWRESRGYQDIPQSIAEVLKSWAWLWRVPFPSTLLGEQAEYPLEIVMLMPPGFEAANFFENVRIGKEADARSIWEKITREGTLLSQIPWVDMDMQQVDRWLVEQEMGSRFMRILIEPFDAEKDPFFSLVTHAPSTLGPKEAAKRLRLCFRDNIETPYSIYEVAFIPFLVTLACANKWGITSPDAWERSPTTSEEVQKTTYTKVDRFLEEMAYWRRALWWLPGERGLFGGGGKTRSGEKIWEGGNESYTTKSGEKYTYTHYGKIMAMLGEYYQSMLLRYGRASAENAYLLANKLYETTRDDYKDEEYGFLRRGNVPAYTPRPRNLKG